MTTIVATPRYILADKRVSFNTHIHHTSDKNERPFFDTETKIRVLDQPARFSLVGLNTSPFGKEHQQREFLTLRAFGISGEVDIIDRFYMFWCENKTPESDFHSLLKEFVGFNLGAENSCAITGITEEGAVFNLRLTSNKSVSTFSMIASPPDHCFICGSGARMALTAFMKEKDFDDTLGWFLSSCYLDNASSMNYDLYDMKEQKLEQNLQPPPEEEFKAMFLKFFHERHYTGPKPVLC